MIISDPNDEQEHIYAKEDCKECKQTRENCECHISDDEKHVGLKKLINAVLNNEPFDWAEELTKEISQNKKKDSNG